MGWQGLPPVAFTLVQLSNSLVHSIHPASLLQWHALSREEQAKYYELARKERQLHMQLYPGWSARDNYVSGQQYTTGERGTPLRYCTQGNNLNVGRGIFFFCLDGTGKVTERAQDLPWLFRRGEKAEATSSNGSSPLQSTFICMTAA